jgi:NAD-dependent deacetylase
VVYPAAGLVNYAPSGIPKYIIDPDDPDLYDDTEWNHIKKRAVKGVPELADRLLDYKSD